MQGYEHSMLLQYPKYDHNQNKPHIRNTYAHENPVYVSPSKGASLE